MSLSSISFKVTDKKYLRQKNPYEYIAIVCILGQLMDHMQYQILILFK